MMSTLALNSCNFQSFSLSLVVSKFFRLSLGSKKFRLPKKSQFGSCSNHFMRACSVIWLPESELALKFWEPAPLTCFMTFLSPIPSLNSYSASTPSPCLPTWPINIRGRARNFSKTHGPFIGSETLWKHLQGE